MKSLLVFSLTVLLACGSGAAQSANRSWSEEKCFRFTRDWNEALRRFGQTGFGAEFLDGGAAFVRSGCLSPEKICPRTPREREIVDVLAIRVVNEGMSTTFLPFSCPASP